jgi:2',3'-cyclic-nucleotide 2'-phosphodiesterase (5'-nucleotidase family)
MININKQIVAAIATAALGCTFNVNAGGTEKITLIHIGDTHGQIEPAGVFSIPSVTGLS